MHDYLPPPIAPISAIWTKARAMFARLGDISLGQWLYALEALARKLVLLEALALAAPGVPVPAFRLPLHLHPLLPAPAPSEPKPRGHGFRLWPKAKPHPARIRLLGKAASAERAREAERQAQIERLKQARAKRASASQRLLRRLKALGCVLEKPLPYARRLARKLRDSSKTFLVKLALKRPPRSPYIEQQVQADTEKHCWAAARAELDARFPDARPDTS